MVDGNEAATTSIEDFKTSEVFLFTVSFKAHVDDELSMSRVPRAWREFHSLCLNSALELRRNSDDDGSTMILPVRVESGDGRGARSLARRS
jgi:hypothetical protein